MKRTTDRPDGRCDSRQKERKADMRYGQRVVLPTGNIGRCIESKFFVYI